MCLFFCYRKVAGLTTQSLLYHKHYDCVQTCKQPLSQHCIQEFGWEFPILLHMSWNVMNPLGPLMSFTYNIFPVIQSVNMSTFPWYLIWLLFHNKVGIGIEGSWCKKNKNKTPSFHCPYLKISSGSEMFNNYSEKLKNENCAHCNHSAGCTSEKKTLQRRVNAWVRGILYR